MGPEFRSNYFGDVCIAYGVKRISGLSYKEIATGLLERSAQTLRVLLSAVLNDDLVLE